MEAAKPGDQHIIVKWEKIDKYGDLRNEIDMMWQPRESNLKVIHIVIGASCSIPSDLRKNHLETLDIPYNLGVLQNMTLFGSASIFRKLLPDCGHFCDLIDKTNFAVDTRTISWISNITMRCEFLRVKYHRTNEINWNTVNSPLGLHMEKSTKSMVTLTTRLPICLAAFRSDLGRKLYIYEGKM